MPTAPLIDRFRRDLDALRVDGDGRMGVAVSGGADSVALLLLAHAAFPGRVEAATVDHRVRPANAEEAAAVKVVCGTLGIEHSTLFVNNPLPANPGQSWARALRYTLLEWWVAKRGLACLLTAHHADDQAETFLMRANRGSGVTGLAGVRASAPMAMSDARLLRPLLGWRASELRRIVIDAAIVPVDDPSNANRAFDRTGVRALLNAQGWANPRRLASAAANAADADAALDWAASRLWGERLISSGSSGLLSLDMRSLPREYRRRLVIMALHHVRDTLDDRRDGWSPRGSSIDRLLRRASEDLSITGWGATLGGVLITVYGADTWHFCAAKPRREASHDG